MTDPWVEFIATFASTLARARRTWSPSETTEIWSAWHLAPSASSCARASASAVRQ